MISPLKLIAQGAFYGAAAVAIGYFSAAPAWRSFPEGKALIKLSLAHGAKRKGECRRLTHDELMKLAPNMRKPVSCPRERLPVFVRLSIDGRVLLEDSFPPTGLSGDGPSRVYRRFVVSAGSHELSAGLRDTARQTGFDYEMKRAVTLEAGQNLAIEFRPDVGGFIVE